MNKVVLVEGLGFVTTSAGKLTGTELRERIDAIPMSKSTAVKLLALNSALGRRNGILTDAKQYLEDRCADTGSYTDSETGLTMIRRVSDIPTITSKNIEIWKAKIKDEEIKIKAGTITAGCKISFKPTPNWTLKK